MVHAAASEEIRDDPAVLPRAARAVDFADYDPVVAGSVVHQEGEDVLTVLKRRGAVAILRALVLAVALEAVE